MTNSSTTPSIIDGWLSTAERRPSPNYNERPDPAAIELIVIHGISLPPGEFGHRYIDDLFCNRLEPDIHPYFATIQGLEVSSHALIRRDGSLTQYVPFHRRAWHAGQSAFEGRENCNDFSIGIELEGTDDCAYETEQYERLAAILKELIHHYPALNPQRIVGHSDIAPGRKTDPGPCFDWQRLEQLLAKG